MRKKVVFFIFLFIGIYCTKLQAQVSSNLRMGFCVIDTLDIKIDTLSLIPHTFTVNGLEENDYTIDCILGMLHIHNEQVLGRSITFSYRVFDIDFSKKIAHKSSDIRLDKILKDPTQHDLFTPSPSSKTLFDNTLQGTGSISRGVSVGTNQSLGLDAHLNLQLSGQLAPNVEILANITDENLPIQPEGNTRVLKDFNKIFIQIKYKDLIKVTAGDVAFSAPKDDYFLKVNRQFLGMEIQVNERFDTLNHLISTVGGGISKGKFTRNIITPVHGVQGPYRLYGAQNETNVVILAGSERVYIDGILLTRGQNNDYVIDYNTGEITFSANQLITNEKRIVVEFEYSDRYYSRYNLYTTNHFTHEKNSRLEMDVNFFHEQDLKNRSIQPELDNNQKLFLSQMGDIQDIIYPSATLLTGTITNEVLYQQRDTLVNGVRYSDIYVYAGANRDSVYRITFSYVGSNKGNYVLSKQTTNGKVYTWVAPQDDVPQGDYEAVIQLNAPKMTDIVTLAARYQLAKKLSINTTFAFSYLDKNLFSKKDNNDNAGLAYQLEVKYQTPLYHKKAKKNSDWQYQLGVNYEYVHQNFSPLESYREVEFSREYNLSNDYSNQTGEQMLKATTGFVHPTQGSTFYTINVFTRFRTMSAIRNEIFSAHQLGTWKWRSRTSYLLTHDDIQKTSFIKTENDVTKFFSKMKIGVKEKFEYNLFRLSSTDSLRSNSYAFNEAALYLGSNDSVKYHYDIEYKNRIDYALYDNKLLLHTVAHEAKVSFDFLRWKHNRFKGTFTYRYDQLRDTNRHFYGEHNFVGSLDYAGNFWKGAVILGAYYEVGSGREQQKEYSFLKVATGQGTHIWNDYNHNGIEELNEFEEARFRNEADYIKVWLPTNQYVNTYNSGTTFSLQLRPGQVWRNKDGFLKFVSMWSNTSILRFYQKNTMKGSLKAIAPFQFKLGDTAVISHLFNLKNTLSFSAPKSYFSMDYTVMKNQTKNLLYYGFESSTLDYHQLMARSVPYKILILKTIYTYSLKNNQCDGFSNRNFRILMHTMEGDMTLNIKQNVSCTAMFLWNKKKNQWGTEQSQQYMGGLDVQYRLQERGMISAKLQYSHISYNADASSSIAYEMLEGLTAGDNILWGVAMQMKLFEYLQLNMQYDGRMTNERRVIHSGLLQLKAFF